MRTLQLVVLAAAVATAHGFGDLRAHMDSITDRIGEAELALMEATAAFAPQNTPMGRVLTGSGSGSQQSGGGGGGGDQCTSAQKADQSTCCYDIGQFETAMMACDAAGAASFLGYFDAKGAAATALEAKAAAYNAKVCDTTSCRTALRDSLTGVPAKFAANPMTPGCGEAMTRRALVNDMLCEKSGADFCFTKFLKLGKVIEAAEGSGSMKNEMAMFSTPILTQLCADGCRSVYGRMFEAFSMGDNNGGSGNGSEDGIPFSDLLGLMCLKGANNEFCLPKMEEIFGSGSGDDDNFDATKMCTPCARALFSATFSSQQAQKCKISDVVAVDAMLKFGCMKNAASNNCADYLAFFGDDDSSSSGSGSGTRRALRSERDLAISQADQMAIGQAAMGLGSCITDTSHPGVSGWSCANCKTSAQTLSDKLGCCIGGVIEMYGTFTTAGGIDKMCQAAVAQGQTFSGDTKDAVRTGVKTFVDAFSASCETPKGVCKLGQKKVKVALKIANVKLSWVTATPARTTLFKNNFVKMLSKKFGVAPEFFLVTAIREGSVIVDYEIQADDDTATTLIETQASEAAAGNEFPLADMIKEVVVDEYKAANGGAEPTEAQITAATATALVDPDAPISGQVATVLPEGAAGVTVPSMMAMLVAVVAVLATLL